MICFPAKCLQLLEVSIRVKSYYRTNSYNNLGLLYLQGIYYFPSNSQEIQHLFSFPPILSQLMLDNSRAFINTFIGTFKHVCTCNLIVKLNPRYGEESNQLTSYMHALFLSCLPELCQLFQPYIVRTLCFCYTLIILLRYHTNLRIYFRCSSTGTYMKCSHQFFHSRFDSHFLALSLAP